MGWLATTGRPLRELSSVQVREPGNIGYFAAMRTLAAVNGVLLLPGLSPRAEKADAGDGLVSIFDGTLKDWDGDPVYWGAENGTLVGEVRPETMLKQNSFIIWRGGELAHFELKLEYRVSAAGNSGINYRSIEVPGVKWAMQGYQDDIDGKDQWSGQNYEERGRKFLAYRGQSVVVPPGGNPEVARELGDRAELQKKVLKENWNEVHIIARGNCCSISSTAS
jgi:Domain of Unknown Function (DUF1080)